MKSNESKGVLNALESFIDKYKLPIILVLTVCLVILPFLMPNDYLMRVLIIIMLYIGFGFGLNMILGEMGLMSLGQAGFVGVGAYTAAICLTKLGWNFIPAVLAGAILAACVGLIIGLPTLRLRGPYLAIVTIGFGEIMRTIFLNWKSVTGGALGIKNIPRPSIFGFQLGLSNGGFYFVVLITVLLVGLMCKAIHDSKYGRAMATIKQDELAATMMGIETTRYKVMGFIISAAISGLFGGYYAMMQRYIDSNSFVADMSVMIVGCVVIGGAATLRGPVLGALLLVTVPEIFRGLQSYRFVFYGVILIVMMIVRPAGLLGWDNTLPYKLPKGTLEFKQKIEAEKSGKEDAQTAE
jgi:branched-chain amino acid transport system permease protein